MKNCAFLSGYQHYKIDPEITISRMYDHHPNGDLRGQKSDRWEGGHRVPLIARWPGQIPAGETTNALVGLNDLLATVMDILDEPWPEGLVLDSQSMLPVLSNPKENAGRRFLVTASSNRTRAIRDGPWKFIDGQGSGGITSGRGDCMGRGYQPAPDEPPGQLYSLERDPKEQENFYLQQPELVTALRAKLREIAEAIPSLD